MNSGEATLERALELHELVLRLASLLRSLARETGLEPVQLQALAYLAGTSLMRIGMDGGTPTRLGDLVADCPQLGGQHGPARQSVALAGGRSGRCHLGC